MRKILALLLSVGIGVTGIPADALAAGVVPEVRNAEIQDLEAEQETYVDLSGEIIQEGGFPQQTEDQAGSSSAEEIARKEQVQNLLMEAWDSFSGECDLSMYQLQKEECRSIYLETLNKNPRYFYVSGGYSYYADPSTGAVTRVLIKYSLNTDEVKAMLKSYDQAIAIAVSQADASWSDMEKALYINDYLARNCGYDQTYSSYTAYDALVRRTAVCQGYALAFLELAQELGLTCEMVSSQSVKPCLNMVKLGSSYYHVDVTWNDPTNDRLGRARHLYFMKSTAFFKADTSEGVRSHLGDVDDWAITGGVLDIAAANAKYDGYFWNQTDMGFDYVGGCWYGFDGVDSICKYVCNGTDFTSTGAVKKVEDIWLGMGEHKGSYWQGKYIGTGSFNGKYYYSTTESIYELDIASGASASVFTLSQAQKQTGYIYGMNISSSGEIQYILAESPNVSGTILTAATLEQPELPHRHTEEIRDAAEATCQTEGYTGDGYCVECGALIRPGTVIGKKEHTVVIDEAVPATCTEAGKTEGSHCGVCNEVIQESEEIPALGHREAIDEAVPATCAEEGKSEGSHCDECGETLKIQEIIPPTGHDWEEDYTLDKPATVESSGQKSIHCRNCDEMKDVQEIPKLEASHTHTPIAYKAVSATCTKDGRTAGSQCGECGEILQGMEEIPALGHDWEDAYTIDKPVTAEGPGEKSIHCSRCEERKDIQMILGLEAKEIDISSCEIQLALDKYIYDGKAKKPAVTVKDGENVLTYAQDYQIKYSDNIHAGTVSVTISGQGNYSGSVIKYFQIEKAANRIQATAKYSKTAKTTAQTFQLDARASGGTIRYQSQNKDVKVSGSGKVTIPKNFVGKAVIKVTAGSGDYATVTKNITVTVNPAGVSLTQVKNASGRKLALKWKKNSKATGYQIQYSTSKKFSGVKSKLVPGAAKTGYTLTGLKKGKTYYVRIRTYKTVAGVKYYSAWSKAKSAAVKK